MRLFVKVLLPVILLFTGSLLKGQNVFNRLLLGKDSVYLYPFPYYNWSYDDNHEYEKDRGRDFGTTDGLFITTLSLPTGKWMAYFNKPKWGPKKEKKDKIAMLFNCSRGTLNGHAIVYNRAGKRIAEGEYLNGLKENTWSIYLDDGKTLVQKLNYHSGKGEGDWEQYEGGKLLVKLHLNDGKREGIQQQFTANGTLEAEFPYTDNEPNGEAKSYFITGALEEVTNYKDGFLQGKQESYHLNGKKASSCTRFQNQDIGWLREWNRDGLLTKETHFTEDTAYIMVMKLFYRREIDETEFIDGPDVSWYDNGKIKSRSFYKSGKLTGNDTSFFENGTIEQFSCDSLAGDKKTIFRVYRSYYEKDHKLQNYNRTIKDSLLLHQSYAPNGRLTYESVIPSYPETITRHLRKGTDTTFVIHKQRTILVREYTNDGMMTYENIIDPKTKNEASKNFSQKGILLYERLISNGTLEVSRSFNKKGMLEKISYSSTRVSKSGHADEEGEFNYDGDYERDNYNNFFQDSARYYNKGIPRNGTYKIKWAFRKFSKGLMADGRQEGTWIGHDGKHVMNVWPEHRGQDEGTVLNYDMCRYNYSIWGHKHPFLYLHYKRNYTGGKKEGMTYELNPGGGIEKETEYHNDEQNGKETSYFSKDKPSEVCYYLNDELNGNMKKWNVLGNITTDRNYVKGVKDGQVTTAYYDTGLRKMEGQYKMGVKIGDWKHYFQNGSCKASIHFYPDRQADSLRKKYGIESLEEENKEKVSLSKLSTSKYRRRRTNVLHKDGDDGDITNDNLEEQDAMVSYFFENGTKAQQGLVLEGTRVGIWNWWREDGSKEKEVDYTKGVTQDGLGDMMSYNGKYTSWYPNGNKSLEAYIMSEDHKYDCRKEVMDNVQNLLYLSGWSEDGSQVIAAGKGYYKGIAPGGIVRSEGKVQNGVKEGPWIYRDENGRIESKGSYVMGLEEGKWLNGDLEGIHSMENACFRNMNADEMERLMKKLEVTECWYHEGVLSSRLRHTNEERVYDKKRRFHFFRRHRYFDGLSIEPRIYFEGGDVF